MQSNLFYKHVFLIYIYVLIAKPNHIPLKYRCPKNKVTILGMSTSTQPKRAPFGRLPPLHSSLRWCKCLLMATKWRHHERLELGSPQPILACNLASQEQSKSTETTKIILSGSGMMGYYPWWYMRPCPYPPCFGANTMYIHVNSL